AVWLVTDARQIVLFSLLQRMVSTPDDIDFRVSLHNELGRVGFFEVIEKLKKSPEYETSKLGDLIDEYEEDAVEDKNELQARTIVSLSLFLDGDHAVDCSHRCPRGYLGRLQGCQQGGRSHRRSVG